MRSYKKTKNKSSQNVKRNNSVHKERKNTSHKKLESHISVGNKQWRICSTSIISSLYTFKALFWFTITLLKVEKCALLWNQVSSRSSQQKLNSSSNNDSTNVLELAKSQRFRHRVKYEYMGFQNDSGVYKTFGINTSLAESKTQMNNIKIQYSYTKLVRESSVGDITHIFQLSFSLILGTKIIFM